MYRLIPVDDKLVIFISFHGRGYTDNPKAIYEQMRKDPKCDGFRYIWFIKHHKDKNITIDGAKVKEYLSIPYFINMAKAKYWIANCKLPNYMSKKTNQVYLQTWHGTPLKRLAHDIIVPEGTTFYRSGLSAEEMRSTYDVDVARYNYMISPNAFCTDVFQKAFRINKERLIETGYPRNDCLYTTTDDEITKIKKKLHLPLNKKVVLYAPTWRDNSFNTSGYTFELKVDFHLWKQILGDDYVVIFKPHYLIVNKNANDPSLQGFIYNIDASEEISDLYLISDILVTDYSSVFFDYANLKRPIYFYMYDLEEYKEELRGFYLDIHFDLPGPIAIDELDLLNKIKNANEFDFNKLKKFNQRFNHIEDGNSAQRVIDIVFHER